MPRLPAQDDFEGWVELLALPHVAKQAYRHLVLSPQAGSAVKRGLHHADDAVRAYCCKLLDRLADEESWSPLIAMPGDPSPSARAEALHALACDRCKTGVTPPDKERVLALAVDLLLHDGDKHVRAIASEVVGRWAVVDEVAAAALLDATGSRWAAFAAPALPVDRPLPVGRPDRVGRLCGSRC